MHRPEQGGTEGPSDEGPRMSESEPAPAEFSIDELAAATGIPSRTIRFYQASGALQKPEIRGRKAFYTASHVERLELIARLQDRGLRIRAIRDVTQRIDKGELVLGEWLGLEERLREPWSDDEPRLLDEAAVAALLEGRPAGLLAELVRLGLLERRGRSFLAPTPGLLDVTLRLQERGVAPEVAVAGLQVMRRHVGKLADELVALYVKNIGDGFGGSGSTPDVAAAFASIRPAGLDAMQLVFAEEMQRALRAVAESGKLGLRRR